MENVLASNLPLGVRSSRTSIWISRVVTGLVVIFLLVDALAKLAALPAVVEATRRLGFPVNAIRPLGLVLALSTLLYVLPPTQLLGALLLTAYLGGATATHVHTGTPFWFPVVMGIIIWVTYYVRSPGLRALIRSTSLSTSTSTPAR